MGGEESKEVVGETVQIQGEGILWTITLAGRESEDEVSEDQYDVGEGCCVFTRSPGVGTEAVYCRTGLDHLRLIRHPNILKFIGSDTTPSCITMVTEPVIPVLGVLSGASVECVVMGWRGVADGLTFLHTKTGLSHNNLSMLSVYVSTVNSQWKVGGLELAFKHSKIDSNFLSSVATLRYKKAIPPEDKTTPTVTPPPHARDVWAFGQFILATIDKADLNNEVGDTLFLYVQDEMLNSDPCRRPTPAQVAKRSWMRNIGSVIFDFLSSLTLKTKAEKETFFSSLPAQLFSLPPLFVAEHLVPLLLTPVVLAEPVLRGELWRHLLTPVTETTQRPKLFDRGRVCPLLQEELFIDHVLPVLLNMFECRELHVRIVLLENISAFASICSKQELMDLILPEVLLGLKDQRVDMIQATLHALGDLVPLVGTEAVLGTSTEQLFTDSKPRNTSPSVGVAMLLAPPTSSPSARSSREERQQRMKLKREQQKLKRQAHSKLGGKVAGGVVQDVDTPTAPPTQEQYSPSISHDEETPNDEVEEWEAPNDEVEEWEAENDKEDEWSHDRTRGTKEGYENSEEWEDFDNERVTDMWSVAENTWGDAMRSGASESVRTPSTSSSTRSGSMKLKLSRSDTPTEHREHPGTPSSGHKVSQQRARTSSNGSSPLVKTSKEASSKFRTAMKGRLSEKDLARLEAKRIHTVKEPDFFADMEPTFGGLSPSNDLSPREVTSDLSPHEGTSSGHSLSSAMQYQPEEQESQGWGDGDEGWNDF